MKSVGRVLPTTLVQFVTYMMTTRKSQYTIGESSNILCNVIVVFLLSAKLDSISPYCNVCRNGKGLGIDFQHCMRCNACVRLSEFDTHKCISQSLQGNCPICHETLFESTAPLRRMDCGHVIHLNCFNTFVMQSTSGSRRKKVRCPLCKKGLNLNYT